MKSFEGRGTIYQVEQKYIIISNGGSFVYCSRIVCPNSFVKGDAVKYRAEAWDPERLPDYLATLNIKAKATMVIRVNAAEHIHNEEAVVSKINHKNQSFLLRYGKDLIYCKADFYYADIEVDDIVRFRAESWENPPSNLADQYVRYKASSVRFVKKPGSVLATGTFNLIDAKGHYGYVDGILMNGSHCNIYVTAGVVTPPCKDLNAMFSVQERSIVRLLAVEQAANRKNSQTKWRATVMTDEYHYVTEDGEVGLDPAYADEIGEEDPGASSSHTAEYEAAEISSKKADGDAAKKEKRSAAPSPSEEEQEGRKKIADAIVFHKGFASIPFDSRASELAEANRKLRMLAHYVTNYEGCDYCLKHQHHPF